MHSLVRQVCLYFLLCVLSLFIYYIFIMDIFNMIMAIASDTSWLP